LCNICTYSCPSVQPIKTSHLTLQSRHSVGGKSLNSQLSSGIETEKRGNIRQTTMRRKKRATAVVHSLLPEPVPQVLTVINEKRDGHDWPWSAWPQDWPEWPKLADCSSKPLGLPVQKVGLDYCYIFQMTDYYHSYFYRSCLLIAEFATALSSCIGNARTEITAQVVESVKFLSFFSPIPQKLATAFWVILAPETTAGVQITRASRIA
jgi:hypothetical protein